MSDNDPTKDFGAKYDTKPTFETILEELRSFRADVEKRFDAVEERLSIRLDRIASEVKETHAEVYTLRADFTELRADFRDFKKEVREHFPFVK